MQRKTLIETKNGALKCLKWHYLTVRSLKNVAVLTEDGAFALFFSSPPRGFDSLRVPTHGNLPFKAKILIPGSQPGGEGWVQVELTDALHFCLIPANHFLIEANKFVSLSLFTFLI